MGKLPNDPKYIPIPFAENGNKNVISEFPSSTMINAASWNYGFPEVTRKDKSDGGLPPSGKDFQGIFYSLSEHTYYQQSGGVYKWSTNLNYPVGAIVLGSNGTWYRALKQSGPNITGVGAKNPVTTANSSYIANEASTTVYWQNIDLVYATTTRTGIVKIGTNIDVADGVISVKTANGSILGLTKQGTNVTVKSDGSINVNTANGSTLGLVKQGNYVTIDNGTISANLASGTTPGVVYQGNYLTIENNGKISVNLANGSTPGAVKQGNYVTIASGTISANKANGTTPGVVSQGNYLTISNTGVISANKANGTTPGVVYQGTNVVIASDGKISVNTADGTSLGVVKQGTNVTISSGVVSVANATTSVKGVVQLTSSTGSTSETLAVTAKALKTVNDTLTTVNNNAVHKTGNETISGIKSFLNDYRRKNTSIVKGTTKPASNIWTNGVRFVDNNDVALGGIENGYLTDKTNRVNMIVYPGTNNSTSTNAQIGVGFDGSGNWFTYAPTPAAADSSSKIATTSWVRNATGNTKLNAATATKLGTANKGSTTQPIYLKAGVPTVCDTYKSASMAPSGTTNSRSRNVEYTAGTNGWVRCWGSFCIWINGRRYLNSFWHYSAHQYKEMIFPVKKGQKYKITEAGGEWIPAD